MKIVTGLAALTALCTIASPAAAKTNAPRADSRPPFSAQDLVTLPRLEGAAVSPDGALAVFPLTETDPATTTRSTALFVRGLADKRAMPLRLDLGGTAGSPAFGDDGWLYFLSDRGAGGADRVWRARIAANGTVSQIAQVTALKTAVGGFALSPDATRIAVWGDIGRECTTFGCDPDGSSHLPGPGTGRLYDGDTGFVRHWDQWETPGVYGRVFAFPLTDGKATGSGVPLDGPAGKGALAVTGENDFRIPYTQGLAAFTALQMKDVPAQLLVFPDENHWVLKGKNSLQWHKTVFDWLDRWLKPAQAAAK